MVKSEQNWAGIFITKKADGTLMPATGMPVGKLYVDGVEDATVITIMGANPYKWSLTLPELSAGQQVQIYITATIDGIDTGFIAESTQAADMFAEIVEDTLSLKDTLRILLAAMAGKSTGGGTSTIKFTDRSGTVNRITASVDDVGNRVNIILDGSDPV